MTLSIAPSFRRRFTLGVAAQGYGQLVNILLQVSTVPILLHAWGVHQLGAWLALSAFPTYLALSDLGFSQIAANRLTMQVAADDRDAALCTFQSTMMLMCCIVGVAACLVGILIWIAPLGEWLRLEQAPAKIRSTVALLSISTFLTVFGGLASAGLRSEGQYARMSAINATGRLCEGSVVLVVAWAHGGLVAAAAAALAARVTTAVYMFGVLRQVAPWVRFNFRHATRAEAWLMAHPSLSFGAYTLSNMINIQGVTIVLSAIVGPAAVVLFTAARTVARLGITASNVISFTLQPEYSRTYGAGDSKKFSDIFAHHIAATIVLAGLYILGMGLAGELVIRTWTSGRLAVPQLLLVLLALGSASEMVWTSLQTPMISTNRFGFVGGMYILASTIGFLALGVALHVFGLMAAGWHAACLGLVMVCVSTLKAAPYLKDAGWPRMSVAFAAVRALAGERKP